MSYVLGPDGGRGVLESSGLTSPLPRPAISISEYQCTRKGLLNHADG